MANAMMVRGFTSPNKHRVQWHQLRLKQEDWITLVSLVALWGGGCFGAVRREREGAKEMLVLAIASFRKSHRL